MEAHILRNILIISVLVLVCVDLSFQQNEYWEYDDKDDGLTPAPRRRPTPPPRRRDRNRGRGRVGERERQRQLERERERQRQVEIEREKQRQVELERERERQELERRRDTGRREREEGRRRQLERESERSRYRYTTTLQPTTTTAGYENRESRGSTDDCGCPTNVEYSINNLNEYMTTSSETDRKTLNRLNKIEEMMQDLNSLVEKVDDDSNNWKSSLKFPGLTVLKKPYSISLTDDGVQSSETFKDCQEAFDRGNSKRGIYNINPEGSPYSSLAFCQDGWTIMQRRFDGSTNFYRTFDEYVNGFGNFSGEFWMGLEMMHQLTIQDTYDLRIDLEGHSGKFYYAVYNGFRIQNEDEDYKLNYANMSAGSGRDGLRKNKGRAFSTRDHDRDNWRRNSCARHYKSGFWLDRCGSDLNRDPMKGVYGGTKWGGRYVKSSLMRAKPTRSMRSKDYRASP